MIRHPRRAAPALVLALALACAFATSAPARAQSLDPASDPSLTSQEVFTHGAAAVGCGLALRYFTPLMTLSPLGGALIVASVCVFALFEAAAT
uniref:Uncharacterized protein n=1 Tax=Eiseniibacteriota bacterium TaxID=2212470 RepID=A0A832I723_UNCEI